MHLFYHFVSAGGVCLLRLLDEFVNCTGCETDRVDVVGSNVSSIWLDGFVLLFCDLFVTVGWDSGR